MLNDYEANAAEGEYYSDYYQRQGKMYFYHLLKPLAELKSVSPDEYRDWGLDDEFEIIKAVGECAGVIIDLVATLIYETEEKYDWALEAFAQEAYADAIYHAYNVFVSGAKALLLETSAKVPTQIHVIREFDKHFAANPFFAHEISFEAQVLQINQNEPSRAFAEQYIQEAHAFLQQLKAYRESQLKEQALNHV
ncbi:MAG: hypothetical protein HC880_19225 [Bacteroidia bacterium]|nr:hypothetical protein [Bacteroidia bacterium]